MRYWNISYGSHLLEFEADSKGDAIELAQEWWHEKNVDTGMKNGEVIEDIAWAISYDNHGKAIGAHKVALHYQHYHGDFAEHNTMNHGGGMEAYDMVY